MNFRSRSPHKRPAFASKDTARARSNGIRIRFSNVPRVACTLRLISRLAHIQRGAHTCSSRAAHTFWICDNTCKFRFVRNSSSPHSPLSLSRIFSYRRYTCSHFVLDTFLMAKDLCRYYTNLIFSPRYVMQLPTLNQYTNINERVIICAPFYSS